MADSTNKGWSVWLFLVICRFWKRTILFGHLQILKKNNSIFIFTFEKLGLYTKYKVIYHRHHIVNQIVQSALTDRMSNLSNNHHVISNLSNNHHVISNLSNNHHVIMLYIREWTGITVLWHHGKVVLIFIHLQWLWAHISPKFFKLASDM